MPKEPELAVGRCRVCSREFKYTRKGKYSLRNCCSKECRAKVYKNMGHIHEQ